MRITKEQAQENRERVIDTASELFRAHGFDGIGVADVMKEAGFTHGGFYNHFDSKEALAAEATRRAFERTANHRERARDLEELLAGYLSRANRRAPAKGCPAAALGSEAGRQPDRVKAEFAQGIEGMIASVQQRLDRRGLSEDEARRRALGIVATMAGALSLARAVPDGHPLADEILSAGLEACRAASLVGAAPPAKSTRRR